MRSIPVGFVSQSVTSMTTTVASTTAAITTKEPQNGVTTVYSAPTTVVSSTVTNTAQAPQVPAKTVDENSWLRARIAQVQRQDNDVRDSFICRVMCHTDRFDVVIFTGSFKPFLDFTPSYRLKAGDNQSDRLSRHSKEDPCHSTTSTKSLDPMNMKSSRNCSRMIGGNSRRRSVISDGMEQDQDLNITLAHVRVRDPRLLTG